jgi:hypothetical protein
VSIGPGPAFGAPAVVTIGLKEIYDQLVSLNTRVEILLADQRDVEARTQDHETRLRALERSRWPLPALAMVVSVATFVIQTLRPW